MDLKVSLEDVYKGVTRTASVSRRVVCRGCRDLRPGSAAFEAKCAGCGKCPPEIRMVHRQMAPGFVVQQQEQAPSKDYCKNDRAELEAVVERGMADGAVVTFERMSEQLPGQIPGDVHLTVRVARHKVFERRGDDLHTEIRVSLREALTGFDKALTHLDGHEVRVRRAAGAVTKPFEVITIKKEGMPLHKTPSQAGNLHCRVVVDFPDRLTDAQREAVAAHF